jgi:hypothetical protein
MARTNPLSHACSQPLLFLLVGLTLTAAPASAQPEDAVLARSEIVGPSRAPAEEPIPLTLVVRSDSDESATVSCHIVIGDRILFGGVAGDETTQFDAAERTLTWQTEIAAHGEARLTFRVLAPEWMSGSGLEVHASVSRPYQVSGVTRRTMVEVAESQRVATTPRVRVGPVLVGAPEVILLLALLAGVTLAICLRRWVRAFAAGIALGAWLLLTALGLLLLDGVRTLVTDVRILTAWQPATATVVDAAAVYRPPGSGGPRSKQSGSSVPFVALRYEVGGKSRIALGFWSASHVFTSWRASRLVAPYVPGSEVTCWIDPKDPSRFVLIRTPGMGHLLLLVLLAAAYGGVRLGAFVSRTLKGAGASTQVRQVESS